MGDIWLGNVDTAKFLRLAKIFDCTHKVWSEVFPGKQTLAKLYISKVYDMYSQQWELKLNCTNSSFRLDIQEGGALR